MTAAITSHSRLTADVADEVRDLSTAAARADGVAALSEASRLALTDSPPGTRHLTARHDGRLIGYAQVWPDDSAELVVHAENRRRGTGSALWRAALEAGAARVWAHGDAEPAQRFAAANGLEPVRSLLKMGRPLTPADRTPRPLPSGYAVVTFTERASQSEDPVGELQALNAAAFADHPEQGRLTVADLRARMAEPWFDPEGLIYVLDESDPTRGPVAFHWTKVEPTVSSVGPPTGEVYVVGVSPAYQGRGLAGPLTDLGLAHLVARGCAAVELYVDGENTPARATYERAGMRVLTLDRVYAPVASRDASLDPRQD